MPGLNKSDIDQRRAARQRGVDVDGKRYTLRRPTEYEKLRFASLSVLEYVVQCLDDVTPFTRADLFDGAPPEPVPFDRDLVFDWLQEHPEAWVPLSDALRKMVDDYDTARAEALKNSEPGSSGVDSPAGQAQESPTP